LFGISVCINLPEKRRQFIVPKQVRNKNCSSSSKLIRQDEGVLSNGFQISAESPNESGPAMDHASGSSRLRFQPVQDDAFCQLVCFFVFHRTVPVKLACPPKISAL